MASPPTPSSIARDPPTSWGPLVDNDQALPVERAAELVAARMRLSIDEVADRLNAMPCRHRYLLLEAIGDTGHSAVYAGVDRLLVREVAIKIHRDQKEHASDRVMFEVRTMSHVEHPNIVQVFDVGEQDGWLYSVAELCETDMQTWCAERSWPEILARIIEVGSGLASLHAAGYVHGDVKPSNILIKKGVAKLADFGLAARPGFSRTVVGTPGFIAPEIAAGYRAASGDVFALAATAWACLFDALPFGDPPAHANLEAAIIFSIERADRGAFAPPGRTQAGLPQLVTEVIQRGLDPDFKHRLPLAQWIDELSAVCHSAQRVEDLRRRLPVAAAVAFVVAFVGVGGYLAAGADRAGEVDEPNTAAQLGPVETPPPSPRLKAEQAARAGDGDAALMAINEAWDGLDELSAAERVELANSATWVASTLEQHGKAQQAQLVWHFAAFLHEQVGQREQAAKAFEAISPTVRTQSK